MFGEQSISNITEVKPGHIIGNAIIPWVLLIIFLRSKSGF